MNELEKSVVEQSGSDAAVEGKTTQDRWTVNMDASLKKEIQAFVAAEEGVTAQDFVRKAYQLYKAQKVIEGENLLADELKRVQQVGEMLSTMLVNANQKINTHIQTIYTGAEERSSAKDKLIAKIEEELETSKSELKETEEKLEVATKERNENVARVVELEKTVATTIKNVEEAKEQIATQNLTIGRLEEEVAENKELRKQLSAIQEKHQEELSTVKCEYHKQIKALEDKLNEALMDSDKKAKEISGKVAEIKDIKKDHARAVKDMEKDHAREIEILKDKSESKLEKEKAALESKLEKEHMKVVNGLQQALAEAETLKKQATLDIQTQCNAKLRELEDVIYQLKTQALNK